MAQPTVILVYR